MRRISFRLSLILLFVIPWENLISVGSVGTLSKTVGLAVGVFWLATVIVTGRFRKIQIFHMLFLLFIVWNAASILWSVDPERTADHVLTYLQLFVLVMLLWDLYTTPAAVRTGVQAYVLGAYVSIASIVANRISGIALSSLRYSATGFETSDVAVILALGIPLALYLVVSQRQGRFASTLKLVNVFYIPAALAGIALTGTRTALIATIPGLLLSVVCFARFRSPERVLTLIAITAAVVIFPSLVPESSWQRLGTTSTEIAEGDLNGRVDIWRAGLAAFPERPFQGYGSNTFRLVVRNEPGTNFRAITTGKVAHNTFLSVLVEVGLIGFALFGAILVIAVRQALRLPKWDAIFWLVVLLTWVIGASALSWEIRKQTWLLLDLIVISAHVVTRRDASIPFDTEPSRNLGAAAPTEVVGTVLTGRSP